MKKYEELTNDDKDEIMELAYKIYNECSGWTLTKEDYKTTIEYFNKLKEVING